jgi:TonB family protein
LLIRGVGAALAQYGVTGVLNDPKLTLFSEHQTVLGTNDNWLSSAGWGQAFSAVGAFSLGVGTRDSALVVSLLPGNYMAQVSGADSTSGVALIEVYDVAQTMPSSVYVLQPVENDVPERFVAYLPIGERVPPIPISKQPPIYPYAARVAGIEGEANILFVVGTSGSVTDAMILDATDLPLGQSALSAVRSWKFQPGTVNGKTAPILMLVPIIFQLNQG